MVGQSGSPHNGCDQPRPADTRIIGKQGPEGPEPCAPVYELRVHDGPRFRQRQPEALIDYEGLGKDAMLSIPTPDHYLPLLYVLGARQQGDAVTFPVEGIDGGSISMLTVRVDSSTSRSAE
jgi:4,5-DOPA dioxygenase extradiol